jgi:hypothetical protein
MRDAILLAQHVPDAVLCRLDAHSRRDDLGDLCLGLIAGPTG